MPRPKRHRKMHTPPFIGGFKPFGVPIIEIDSSTLLFEEYESIKLADYFNLTQEEAAKWMNISRPTFTRIYTRARKKVAEAFVEGKVILIEGGNVQFEHEWYKCEDCNEMFKKNPDKKIFSCPFCHSKNIKNINECLKKKTKTTENNQKLNKSGKGGFCICIHCTVKVPHQKGIPCKRSFCPKCGRAMIRENSYHHKLFFKNK